MDKLNETSDVSIRGDPSSSQVANDGTGTETPQTIPLQSNNS